MTKQFENKQQISNDLIVYQGLYYKFINEQIKQQSIFRQHKNCSYAYLNYGKCPQYIYDAFTTDGQYSLKVDLFFHRTNFTYDSFEPEGQIRLRKNWDFYFFAKSAIQARKNDLINISIVYNSFNDSLLTITPGQQFIFHLLKLIFFLNRLTNLSSVNYLSCMGNQYKEPYDPRCREWYQNALQHPGNQFFKPYQDFFTHTTIMTASARIDDPLGNNISIISVDFIIANLINNLFARQDQSSNFDTHSVLFHQDQNTVYYHPNWNANERTIVSWQNLEFNNSDYDLNEYSKFTMLVQNSKDYSLTGQYDIESYVNVTQFFQFWTKNQIPYMSLIYPLQIVSPQNVWNQTMVSKQVLMVAKVREDISGIFKIINLTHDTNYKVILFVETSIVLAIIIILTLHFAAILQYQVEIPLEKLTVFINQNTDQFRDQNNSKEKQYQKIYQTDMSNKSLNYDLKKQIKLSKRKSNNQENLSLKIDKSPNIKNQISTNFQLLTNKTFQLNNEEVRFDNIRQNKCDNIKFKNKQEELFKQESYQEKYNSSSMQNRTEKDQSVFRLENLNEERQISYFNIEQKAQMAETSQYLKLKNKLQFEKLNQILNNNDQKNNYKISDQPQKVNLEEDLDPMFLEMQIIKDTFYQLQSVISFKKNDIQQYSKIKNMEENQDEGRCILHYAFAYKLFRQLKNNFGVALSSLNLGYFCYKKNDFVEALIYYESAMIHCIIDMGFSSIHEFMSQWKQSSIQYCKSQEAINQKLTIICTSLILSSLTIKEVIHNKNDLLGNKNVFKIFFSNFQVQKNQLKLALFYAQTVLNIAQQLILLNKTILSDEIIIIIETNYLEIIHDFAPVEEVEMMIQNLEQKIEKKKYLQVKLLDSQLNQFSTQAVSPFKKFSDKNLDQKNVTPKKELLREFEKNNFEKLLLILSGKLNFFNGINKEGL
ncbi:transmembrane protein, putative (macronuclear) [Tetrahymena thermophila SB210]|uniref:Transmembrane protein, putative n=1 Tax=Tetrahymena thermophila (strain SB210) TaxID=312017 RepID=I7MJE2_TETTS|nr:transmembrane protein, putative [Tetrahymena thermophila SB210]EAR96229.2 transmembrane protein, putative [Tetrahymena thermophila SB210]|eukprot:XP_001016474.2 transmembrane protein, putative [Tetrahymena thermophila SB210]